MATRRRRKQKRYKSNIDLNATDDFYIRGLCSAVCLRAVRDYKTAKEGHHNVPHRSPEDVIEECIDFFDTPMFQEIVHVPSTEVCKLIEKFEGDLPIQRGNS